MVSHYGNDNQYRVDTAKLLAILLLSMRASPCIYQGSEIGMTNIILDSIEEHDDLEAKNLYREWEAAGKDTTPLFQAIQMQGRDNARTPMQWNNSNHAGFTDSNPWMKVNPNHTFINVEAALKNKNSIFYFYKKMLELRKTYKTLVYGDFELLAADSEQIFAYRRWDEEHEFIILLNFSEATIPSSSIIDLVNCSLLLGNYPNESPDLQAWEARLYIKIKP